MGLRFRRTVMLAPGVRLNLSQSGLGLSLHLRAAAPPVELTLDAAGVVQFADQEGAPLPIGAEKRVRAAHGAEIRAWLTERCAEWNRSSERLLNLHHETPGPDAPLDFEAHPFAEPQPEPFIPREPDFRERSWPPARKKFEDENAAGKRAYEEALWAWRRRRSAHEAAEAERRKALEIGRYGDRVVMERFLTERLAALAWPTETAIAFELSLDATALFLDVDLPELELIPAREVAVAARGLRLGFKDLSEAQVRRAYAWHVHGVLFRLIGEAFAALPGVQRIIASGYSQRLDGATGRLADDYLISAEVERALWGRIDFANLEALDLLAAFERFALRRKLTRHGIFTAIEPFGASLVGGLFG
jgi:hypothetical protein